jgi:hypothetical protein
MRYADRPRAKSAFAHGRGLRHLLLTGAQSNAAGRFVILVEVRKRRAIFYGEIAEELTIHSTRR